MKKRYSKPKMSLTLYTVGTSSMNDATGVSATRLSKKTDVKYTLGGLTALHS